MCASHAVSDLELAHELQTAAEAAAAKDGTKGDDADGDNDDDDDDASPPVDWSCFVPGRVVQASLHEMRVRVMLVATAG
jgi:hypothetical protein